MSIKEFFYLPLWFFKAKFLSIKKPLKTVLFISDECNLQCRHCCVYSQNQPIIKTFEQIKEELIHVYQSGSRFVDFEGGEPFLWRDGAKNVNDLFRLAKDIGFFSTTVTTNAQLPFNDCCADSVWVSLDGIGAYHDAIRGTGSFDKLAENIAQNPHPHLNANMVINSLNYHSVEETLEWVKQHPKLKLLAFNFHTPFAGTEDLFLDWNLRTEIIDKIIDYKKRGYPIMNSVSGLKLMKTLKFKKVCWITGFILPDGKRLSECAGKHQNLCSSCGFCMAGEMAAVFSLNPKTILDGLKLRFCNF